MLEKTIEQKLVAAVRAAGGFCPKLTCPGTSGMPDRLILMPGGRLAFAELKAPGKKPRPLQQVMHLRLMALGFRVYVIDAPAQIEGVLYEVVST